MKINIALLNNNNEIVPHDFIKYSDKLYLLYDAKFINPPFFDNIFLLKTDLTTQELKMIYNMVKIGGSIYFIESYNYFYKSNNSNNKLYRLVKKNNIVYNDFAKFKPLFDFIIMGTQKGGTTALASNIGQHPRIAINMDNDPMKSEIHFFDIQWQRGREWFKKELPRANHGQLIGFKNPDLMCLEYTFPLIQSLNPYVKIILTLRNPIYRAYSAWKLQRKYFGEKRDFEEAIEYELHVISKKFNKNNTFFTIQNKYLERGLYYKQIKKILEWFSIDNLLILIQEDVLENMNAEYNKVYQFLNIDNNQKWKHNYKKEFVSDDKSTIVPSSSLYKKLVPYFLKDVRNLEAFLGRKIGWF